MPYETGYKSTKRRMLKRLRKTKIQIHMCGYLILCYVQDHFTVFQSKCIELGCNSKTEGYRGNGLTLFWFSGTCRAYMGYLWPHSVQYYLRILWCPFFKRTVISIVGCRDVTLGLWSVGAICMSYLWPCCDQGNFQAIQLRYLKRLS